MERKRLPETERLYRLSEPDRAYWSQPDCILAGMDEVGRGPLAGPVTVACVVMPEEPLIPYINDSKKMTPKRRETAFDALIATARAYSLSWVEPAVIDEINILQATRRAFAEAFSGIRLPVTDVLIDALSNLDIPARQHPIIHGDALSYSIACASVIAKVARDRYMTQQDAVYPMYGFAKNKGYGTAEHISALRQYGPCPLHRRSFITHFV